MAVRMTPQYETPELKAHKLIAEAGDTLPKHSSSHDGILIVLDGALTFWLEAARHPLTAGQHLRIPAGIVHHIDFDSAATLLLILPQGARIQKPSE